MTRTINTRFGFVFILVAFFLIAGLLLIRIDSFDLNLPVKNTYVDVRAGTKEQSGGIEIEYNRHATDKHGVEAEQARDAFLNCGDVKYFKLRYQDRYARICNLGDGWFAFQEIRRIGKKVYVEVSSYIPHLKDATWQKVIDWMLYNPDWSSFSGPLP